MYGSDKALRNMHPYTGSETVSTNGRITSERYWLKGREVSREEYMAPRDHDAEYRRMVERIRHG